MTSNVLLNLMYTLYSILYDKLITASLYNSLALLPVESLNLYFMISRGALGNFSNSFPGSAWEYFNMESVEKYTLRT